MPTRPPSPCQHPGCPATTTGRRCTQHQRDYDRQHPRHKLYGTKRWRQLRGRYITDHPWCAIPGCTLPATDVDHIVPLPDGAPYDETNLQALCKRHHSQKTQREVFGRKTYNL